MEDGTIIGRVLDFEAIATDALLNERRLGSLRELRRGVGVALDFDRYRPSAAVVWVVGRDDYGNDLESLVALVEADGSWSASDWSEADCDWADLAATARTTAGGNSTQCCFSVSPGTSLTARGISHCVGWRLDQ